MGGIRGILRGHRMRRVGFRTLRPRQGLRGKCEEFGRHEHPRVAPGALRQTGTDERGVAKCGGAGPGEAARVRDEVHRRSLGFPPGLQRGWTEAEGKALCVEKTIEANTLCCYLLHQFYKYKQPPPSADHGDYDGPQWPQMAPRASKSNRN